MFRTAIAAFTFAFAAGTAYAGDVTMLRKGETVQVASGATQAVAFYTVDRKGMNLTMLLTDAEGDLLRTRVRMADGQTHSVTLEALDDDTPGHRYTFHRIGPVVQMTAKAVHTNTTVAAR